MSDTSVQAKVARNQNNINHLKSLYKQENSLRIEINHVKDMIKKGAKYVNIRVHRGYQVYDIDWSLKNLIMDLKVNQDMIKLVRSQLVIS